MSGAEKTFENKIKKLLSDYGCYTIKNHGDAFSRVGIPDLTVCYKGKFLGLEVKAINGKPSELQLLNLREINGALGFGAIIIPTLGKKRLKAYISKNYPNYIDTRIIDYEDLVEYLKICQ